MLVKVLVLLASVFVAGGEVCSIRCYPGEDCFPGIEELVLFSKSLEGSVLFPTDADYHNEILMHNYIVTKFPAVVALVNSTQDVKKSLLFARKHNLRVTVSSSGHDYIGRSTGHGSLQINLSKMRKIKVDLSSSLNQAGTATIESGAPWVEVYKELDKYDRVIVGGSAHSVAQGGYTQGGGHSPICRSLGLAVDNVLEMTVVTSDGRIVNANSSELVIENLDGSVIRTNDTDLFWALRGGGGGTYGIVTSYKYKIHQQPKQMVVYSFSYLLSYNGNYDIGKRVFNFYNNFVKTMPREWGGYMSMSNVKSPLPSGGYGTEVSFLFNHFGEWNLPSRKIMDQWKNFHPESQLLWSVKNVSSFWGYEQDVHDAESYSTYLMNTFVQKEYMNETFANFMADMMSRDVTDDNPNYFCTGTHIGGKVSDAAPNDTPVHPGFRSGLISLSCGYIVDMSRVPFFEKKGMAFYNMLKNYGNGVYVNEPSADLTDWKDQFWGPHYQRLLQIKQKWDPDNFLTCLHCVGSDLGSQSVTVTGAQKPIFTPGIVGK